MEFLNILQSLLLMLRQILNVPTNSMDKAFVAPPLIPRSVLFGDPDKSYVGINSNGHTLLYMSPFQGTNNVWIEPLDGSTPPKLVTMDTTGDIRRAYWTHNPEILIYYQDTNGDENFRIYKVNVTSNTSSLLIGKAGSRANLLDISSRRPNEMLVSYNARNPAYFDVVQVHLRSGEVQTLYENDRFKHFIVDNDLRLRLAVENDKMGNSIYFKMSAGLDIKSEPDFGANWKVDFESYRNVSVAASYATYVAGFDDTNDNLYWADSTSSDTSALVLKPFNEPNAAGNILFWDEKSDISAVWFDPTTRVPFAVLTNFMKPKVTPINEEFEADFAFLSNYFQVAQGIPIIRDKSDDMKVWIIKVTRDDYPVTTYAYDRVSKTVRFLFSSFEDLTKFQQSKKHPVEIKTRDGLTEVCYVTIPVEKDLHSNGVPLKPLPMVLLVHGGPTARDRWNNQRKVQFFANRGYAVLQCNYRGSTTYGKRFLSAMFGEWGRKVYYDLVDAVRWAITAGIADPQRIAIAGGSYGGYSALLGLTVTPDLFACAVDIVGPSNLLTLYETIPPYWESFKSTLAQMMGATPDTQAGMDFLKSRSPLFSVDRIQKPLLIAQGAHDVRVNKNESDQVVNAMKRNQLPVTYLLFHNEGHGLYKPANSIAFNAITELFLNSCLGGRFEPLGDVLKEANMTIVEKGDLDI